MTARAQARRPKPRPIDRAAWAICESVESYAGRCACKAAKRRACGQMVLTAQTALARMMSAADAHRLREVIEGLAVLTVRDAP